MLLTAFSNIDCVGCVVGVTALLDGLEFGVVCLSTLKLRARALSLH